MFNIMEKRGRIRLADILFWLAIIILIIWAIIKSFFIHSEPWQIYIPISFTVILFALSFWEKIGRFGAKLNYIAQEIKRIKEIDIRLMKIETEHNFFMNKRMHK